MFTAEVCEAILRDHYRKPRHRGACDGGGRATEENPLCGDVVTVTAKIEEGLVACARFEGAGCAVSQAGASLVLGLVQARPWSETEPKVRRLIALLESGTADPEAFEEEFAEAAALLSLAKFPARVVCATLGARALLKASVQTPHGAE